MKANELMTGDWVKLKKDHCKFLQLTAIDETYNSINYFDGDAEGELTLQLTAIEPIPLTPEILRKNGFGNEMSKYLDGDEIEIELNLNDWELEDEDGFLDCCYQKPITYVHELQRALRLLGIKKRRLCYESTR